MLTTILFPSLTGAAASTTPSPRDVPKTHKAYNAIMLMLQTRFMEVDAQNKFRPSEPVTRADIAMLFAKLIGGDSFEAEYPAPASSVEQLKMARDAQRRSDTNTILNALYQYAIDNNGTFPATLPAMPKEICNNRAKSSCTGLVDLHLLIDTYLVFVPIDPLAKTTDKGTGYKVFLDAQRRVTVTASKAEGDLPISVTR